MNNNYNDLLWEKRGNFFGIVRFSFIKVPQLHEFREEAHLENYQVSSFQSDGKWKTILETTDVL